MPQGEERGAYAGGDADLVVDVLDVVVDGLRRQDEELGHLAVRSALADQAKHLDLAIGQAGGSAAPCAFRLGPMTGRS